MRAVKADPTTERLVALLSERMAAEPTAPDPREQTGHHLALAARIYDDWQSHVDSLRLLIGARMTNLALATYAKPEPINVEF